MSSKNLSKSRTVGTAQAKETRIEKLRQQYFILLGVGAVCLTGHILLSVSSDEPTRFTDALMWALGATNLLAFLCWCVVFAMLRRQAPELFQARDDDDDEGL